MGIQDRDYWRERYKNQPESSSGGGSSRPPANTRTFRVIDEVRYPRSEPGKSAESHSPERVLGVLTVISAFIVVAFISYQVQIDRAEKQAQQQAAQQAAHASKARADAAMASAAAQAAQQERAQAAKAAQQERAHAVQLEQKKLLLEKLNKDAERKLQRDAAWERFYRPSSQCKNDWTVDCANILIRARARFDEQYKN